MKLCRIIVDTSAVLVHRMELTVQTVHMLQLTNFSMLRVCMCCLCLTVN